MEPKRIDQLQARRDGTDGALLVCAYDTTEKCNDNHIDGALSLQQLQAFDDLSKTQEIIFYCA